MSSFLPKLSNYFKVLQEVSEHMYSNVNAFDLRMSVRYVSLNNNQQKMFELYERSLVVSIDGNQLVYSTWLMHYCADTVQLNSSLQQANGDLVSLQHDCDIISSALANISKQISSFSAACFNVTNDTSQCPSSAAVPSSNSLKAVVRWNATSVNF